MQAADPWSTALIIALLFAACTGTAEFAESPRLKSGDDAQTIAAELVKTPNPGLVRVATPSEPPNPFTTPMPSENPNGVNGFRPARAVQP